MGGTLVHGRNILATEGVSWEWNAGLNGYRMDECRTDTAFLLLERGTSRVESPTSS